MIFLLAGSGFGTASSSTTLTCRGKRHSPGVIKPTLASFTKRPDGDHSMTTFSVTHSSTAGLAVHDSRMRVPVGCCVWLSVTASSCIGKTANAISTTSSASIGDISDNLFNLRLPLFSYSQFNKMQPVTPAAAFDLKIQP